MNGATIQNTPAATSQFPSSSVSHVQREISLVFCTITCEGSAAPTVTASLSSLSSFPQLNFCPLSSPKGKEDERIPRPWGESRISLRKQSFLLWVETRLFFALPFVSRNAKSFSFNAVEFVFCEEDMSTRGKIVD